MYLTQKVQQYLINMIETNIHDHLNFKGKAELRNTVFQKSISLPSALNNTIGGIYYNTIKNLFSFTMNDSEIGLIPYISDIPTDNKLLYLDNNGKINAINNTSTNKFVYLNENGLPNLSRYINKDWIDPNFLTNTIINSENVLPTSKAVYDAIEGLGDITGDYLPLTGGTLSGALFMGNGNGIPIKFLNTNGLVGSIWSSNGGDLKFETSNGAFFTLRNSITDALASTISLTGSIDSKEFNISVLNSLEDFKNKIIGFSEINLKGDNLITFDTLTTNVPSIFAVNVDDEGQINIKSDHIVIGNSDKYFHISGNTLTSNDGASIGLLGAKIKDIYTQNLFVDNLTIPSSNGISIKQFNQEIRSTLNTDSPNTILSETAIFNAINNKLSLATTIKDGMIPMLPTDGELYYLNGDNLWIEKEWVVSTIDGKKYLSTGVGDFKSFNVSLIANGEISIGSEYLILETIPTTDPNIADSAYPTGLYIGRISTKPSSAGSSLYVAGSIRGTAFTSDTFNYWKLLGVGTGTVTPNKILYVNINGVSYGIPATDNLT